MSKEDLTQEQKKEKLRIAMLGVFDGDIVKHNTKYAGSFYSDRRDDNPDSLHNRVARSMEP